MFHFRLTPLNRITFVKNHNNIRFFPAFTFHFAGSCLDEWWILCCYINYNHIEYPPRLPTLYHLMSLRLCCYLTYVHALHTQLQNWWKINSHKNFIVNVIRCSMDIWNPMDTVNNLYCLHVLHSHLFLFVITLIVRIIPGFITYSWVKSWNNFHHVVYALFHPNFCCNPTKKQHIFLQTKKCVSPRTPP